MARMASERSTVHQPTAPDSRRLSPIAVLLLLALAGAGAYWNQFDNAFQFDDFHSIVQNPSIRSFAAWRSWFTDLTAFSVLPENLNYRPLLLLSYAISYRMGKLEVWGFHLVNWLIHVGGVPGSRHRPPPLRAPCRPSGPTAARRGMALAAERRRMAAVAALVFPASGELGAGELHLAPESLATLFVLSPSWPTWRRPARPAAGGAAGGALAAGAAAFTAGSRPEIAITLPALVVAHDLVLGPADGSRRRLAPAQILTTGLGGSRSPTF
jgi:hypothetical protein